MVKSAIALFAALVGVGAGTAEHTREGATTGEAQATPGTQEMETMIAAIQADARRTADYTGIERIGKAVIDALRATPRENFVTQRNRPLAYANHPLPIGHGQTISQPFIVAVMTEALGVEARHRVLEIGTGSGYQAAVLAQLADAVYTIEIVSELAAAAEERLARLGYGNIHVRAGDGWHGWPQQAPFDGIVVTAVGDEIPPALIEQLAADGRLVMPVGDPDGFQELVVYSKRDDAMRRLFPVRFVPLTGIADD